MTAHFIPNSIASSEAIRIAATLGCRIQTNTDLGQIRLSPPLIARTVNLSDNAALVSRQAISFLREIAGLYPRKSPHR